MDKFWIVVVLHEDDLHVEVPRGEIYYNRVEAEDRMFGAKQRHPERKVVLMEAVSVATIDDIVETMVAAQTASPIIRAQEIEG